MELKEQGEENLGLERSAKEGGPYRGVEGRPFG